LSVQLPREIVELDGLPYTAFWIDGYLPVATDIKLCSDFPTGLMMQNLGNRLAVNLDLINPIEDIGKFLETSVVWRDYVEAWKSPDVLMSLLHRFAPAVKNRYQWPWRWILLRRLKNRSNLELTVLLSVYRRGFQLAPHSDDRHKLISLIHYLPELDSASQGDGGTSFYVPKSRTKRRHLRQFSPWSGGFRQYLPLWLSPILEAGLTRRYFESEQIDSQERNTFDKYFSKACDVGYARNRISGFVKNDWSFHEVNLTNFPLSEIRRAVLINVRVHPSRIVERISQFESRIVRMKKALTRGAESDQ